MEVIAIILEQLLSELIGQGIKYIIRKTVDALGNTVTEILYKYDSDGDGIEDAEQVIYTLDTLIPDMSEGYAIVNQGDEIGIGLPQYELIDSVDMADRLIDTVTGNNNGYLIGDDVYVPLPFDFSGDGLTDWGSLNVFMGQNTSIFAKIVSLCPFLHAGRNFHDPGAAQNIYQLPLSLA